MMHQAIQSCLEKKLDCVFIEVEGDGQHFVVKIVSNAFNSCNRIERHKMVYQALGEPVGREIHALSIQAYTPDEWQKLAPSC